MLANEWDAEELDAWGLDLPMIENIIEEAVAEEDNYEIPEEIETDIVLGDLFEIGNHKLLCGSSTEVETWEKLFGERMCRHFSEDFGLEVRIARYHNVYGPHGTYDGGREKAPAAACRKVHELATGAASKIQIWGDGNQVRSFTYITDCIDGTLKLMNSEFSMPLNIGSAESITIQQLYDIALKAADVSQAEFEYNFTAPQGVRGRSSENTLCRETLGWAPSVAIDEGIRLTYAWISQELNSRNNLKI